MRVVRHLMSRRGDRPDELGMAGGAFADDKEGRADPARREQYEDLRRVLGIGPVVDGQPHLAPGGGEAQVRASQVLGTRREQVVGQQCVGQKPAYQGGCGHRPSDQQGRSLASEIEEARSHMVVESAQGDLTTTEGTEPWTAGKSTGDASRFVHGIACVTLNTPWRVDFGADKLRG